MPEANWDDRIELTKKGNLLEDLKEVVDEETWQKIFELATRISSEVSDSSSPNQLTS